MKKIVHFYVRFIQKILITIFLTILYFLVLSVTKFFIRIIPKKNKRRSTEINSFWIHAEGYKADMNSALEQS